MRHTYSAPIVLTGLACVLGFVSLATASTLNESFGPPGTIAEPEVSIVLPLDVDEDGDLDIVFADQDYYSSIGWYENLGGGLFDYEETDISEDVEYPEDLFLADVDGDGDDDLLSASSGDGKIAWDEFLGGGDFGVQQVITTDADGACSVCAADLDGDGDTDVVCTARGDNTIAWYENLGGGIFGPQQVITLDADDVQDVDAADLDGDGDLDVLSASPEDSKIAWYENLGGGTFGSQQVITISLPGVSVAQAVDLDGDGDVDVLTEDNNEDKVVWLENQGGGTFNPGQTLYEASNEYVEEVCAADVDGDGDPDVLVVTEDQTYWVRHLTWIENLGGGAFGAPVELVQSTGYVEDIQVLDVDGDGDLDFVVNGDEEIRWFENLGGGSYHRWVAQSTYGKFDATCAADLDADGDPDILSGEEVRNYEGLLCWTENRMGGLPPTAAYCFGDGTGGACPCGNPGRLGEGCANSTSHGSTLSAVGEPSVGFDSLILVAHHIPTGMSCLFFQGDTPVGDGVPFGDGLRCVGPPFVRLEVGFELGTGAALTQSPISITGGALPGQTKYYQCWYRDAGASPCGFEFNLSNGVSVVWGP